MTGFLVKTLFSALLIALVSELAKRSTLLGALMVAVPLTSVLSLVWLWRETGDAARVAALSTGIFWMVLPTLPLFLVLPTLLKAQWPFYAALLASLAVSVFAGLATVQLLKRFDVTL